MELDMHAIGLRIKNRRKELALTQTNIKTTVGISSGNISDIENGNRLPAASTLVQLANVLECSIDWILTGDNQNSVFPLLTATQERLISTFKELDLDNQEEILDIINLKLSRQKNKPQILDNINIMQEESSYSIEDTHKKTIPILGIVAAGKPILSYESELDSIQPENEGVSYALIAKGNSMNPIILDGEIVEVINQQELENGEIGIIKVDDEVTCKRYYKFEDRIELRSINQDYDPIIIFKTSSKNLQIVGKVILTRVQQSRF